MNMDLRLKPGRKPLGDRKKIQINFYVEKAIEDELGKAFCKDFCINALHEEYERVIKEKEKSNN